MRADKNDFPQQIFVINILNNCLKEDYNPYEKSYADLWQKRFVFELKNYTNLPIDDYSGFYQFNDENEIEEYKAFKLNAEEILTEDELREFRSFLQNRVSSETNDLNILISNYAEQENFSDVAEHKFELRKVIDKFFRENNKQGFLQLDCVNRFREKFGKSKLKLRELLEGHFQKNFESITTADILGDQEYYEFIDDESLVNYGCWLDMFELPDLNTKNPGLRKHLYESANDWIRFGIDGFRLDVPENIKFSPGNDETFWSVFREKCLKTCNEIGKDEFFILGELWGRGKMPKWLQARTKGEYLGEPIDIDASMNYPFRDIIVNFLAGVKVKEESDTITASNNFLEVDELDLDIQYDIANRPKEATDTMMNLVSSHDVRRIRAMFKQNAFLNPYLKEQGEEKRSEKAYFAALVMQFTLPGVPSIYYGDEIGLTGLEDDGFDNAPMDNSLKGYDPFCRGTMPWLIEGRRLEDILNNDKENFRTQIFEFHKKLIEIRFSYSCLRTGDFRVLSKDDKNGVYVYYRANEENMLIIAICNGINFKNTQKIVIPEILFKPLSFPEEKNFTDLLSGQAFTYTEREGLIIDFTDSFALILK